MSDSRLSQHIKSWGRELGFQQTQITHPQLDTKTLEQFKQWLIRGYHGEMTYMEKHKQLRADPGAMVDGSRSVIMVRLDYLPPNPEILTTLNTPTTGFISRYALGRDYHKLIRKRLGKLAKRIEAHTGQFNYRPFADSAPIMEKPLAQLAGLGWIGKHTNLINPKAGSWFFLGALLTDLDLPIDEPFQQSHCGSCQSCIDICPTQAIVAPFQLDASRCISYLTIELKTAIPVELRPLMGNRIYGCDDCQLVCPWNKFAKTTHEIAFHPRHGLNNAAMVDLFAWTEKDFLHYTEGSAIRRIGHECWLRNIAVALGNAPSHPDIIKALQSRRAHPSELVREHVLWALTRHENNACDSSATLQ